MAATGQINYIEFPTIDIAKTKKFTATFSLGSLKTTGRITPASLMVAWPAGFTLTRTPRRGDHWLWSTPRTWKRWRRR